VLPYAHRNGAHFAGENNNKEMPRKQQQRNADDKSTMNLSLAANYEHRHTDCRPHLRCRLIKIYWMFLAKGVGDRQVQIMWLTKCHRRISSWLLPLLTCQTGQPRLTCTIDGYQFECWVWVFWKQPGFCKVMPCQLNTAIAITVDFVNNKYEDPKSRMHLMRVYAQDY
jgi:hypothetical protein